MLKRAERVVPPYFLMTVVLFSLWILFPNQFTSVKELSADYFIRSTLYVSFTQYKAPIVFVGWTLEFEMFFYALTAIALAYEKKAINLLPTVIATLVALGIAFQKEYPLSNVFLFYTNPIILEFAFGFLIAKFYLTDSLEKISFLLLTGTLVLLALNEPYHRAILAGIPSTILLYFCLIFNAKVTLPKRLSNSLSKLGDASYSIYLIQVLSLPLAIKVLKMMPISMNPTTVGIIAIVFTMISGWMFFYYIESSLLKVIKLWTTKPLKPRNP